jgi:hypothetical protein
MKANELRIGNLVLDYGIITEINGFLITRLEEINRQHKIVVNISPIPLTEEWMTKLGFSLKEDNQENEYFEKGHVKLIFFRNSHKTFHVIFGTDIYHVHQLQNLYFALTGEELQYTQAGGV